MTRQKKLYLVKTWILSRERFLDKSFMQRQDLSLQGIKEPLDHREERKLRERRETCRLLWVTKGP